MTAADDLRARWAAVMMDNYGTPPVAIARGEGCRVWDVDGIDYLDCIAGIAVSALGHAHPALLEAVRRQVGVLAHSSNLFVHEPGVALAERLVGMLGSGGRVFFCNDGAEANEAALKIVRRHGWTADPSGGRLEVVAAEAGFHGRTFGALSLTGVPSKRDPFAPLPGPVTFVPYGDEAALRAAVTGATAAVFLEPTLGEGGVVPPPPGYLAAAREACDTAGALLVIDEVQSGVGRTGTWFAHQEVGVRPDVVTLAKGLGGGLPIGATVAFGSAADLLGPGSHGSTFGGNPVSCAGALAVLDTIERDDLLASVRTVGDRLAAGLAGIPSPLVKGVRGSGLWRAIVLTRPVAAQVEAAARQAGVLVNAVQPDAVRVAPPLILTAAEADEAVAALATAVAEVEQAATVGASTASADEGTS